MDCPRTGKPMVEIEINDVKIDVSTGCGGIWFDNFELKKFDEPLEAAGEQLIAESQKYFDDSIDTSPRLNSPRHPDVMMQRHYFSFKRAVEIDVCPQSGGVWLDPGELQALRSLFASEAEKERATEREIEALFDACPEVQELKAKSAEQSQRVGLFRGMFKFLGR